MARFNCEFFGIIRYSLEISYHELYEVEEQLIQSLQDVLQSFDGQHLDFWGYGDFLQLQGEFADYEPEEFRELCTEIAGALPEDVTGKLLFVDKRLKSCTAYTLAEGAWQELQVDISAEAFARGDSVSGPK